MMARRGGKSALGAQKVAKALRDGKDVYLAGIGHDGEPVYEKIVGVPGFPDGRQLGDFTGVSPEKPSSSTVREG